MSKNQMKKWYDLSEKVISKFFEDDWLNKFADLYLGGDCKCNKKTNCPTKTFEKYRQKPKNEIDFSDSSIWTADFNKNFLMDKDDHFELTLDVDKNSTAKNISIDVENNQLTIKYNYEEGNCKTTKTIIETIPSNADDDTITANVVDGKLTVKIDKLPEEVEFEIDTDEVIDPTIVKINKK